MMLADELNRYRERGNKYINDNIQKIQDLYKEKEQRLESRKVEVKEEKLILIKPYEIFISASTTKSSFIQDEVKNLMKFIHSPIQMRLFKPLPYYQSLRSRGE